MKLYNIEISEVKENGKYKKFSLGKEDNPGRCIGVHCNFEYADESNKYYFDMTNQAYPRITHENKDEFNKINEIPGWIAYLTAAGSYESGGRITSRKSKWKGSVSVSKENEKNIDVVEWGSVYCGKEKLKKTKYNEYLVLIYDIRYPVYFRINPVNRKDYWLIFRENKVEKIKINEEEICNNRTPDRVRTVELKKLFYPREGEALKPEDWKKLNKNKYRGKCYKDLGKLMEGNKRYRFIANLKRDVINSYEKIKKKVV